MPPAHCAHSCPKVTVSWAAASLYGVTLWVLDSTGFYCFLLEFWSTFVVASKVFLHHKLWRHGNCEIQWMFNGHLVASRMLVGSTSETGAYFILVFQPRGRSLHGCNQMWVLTCNASGVCLMWLIFWHIDIQVKGSIFVFSVFNFLFRAHGRLPAVWFVLSLLVHVAIFILGGFPQLLMVPAINGHVTFRAPQRQKVSLYLTSYESLHIFRFQKNGCTFLSHYLPLSCILSDMVRCCLII